MIASQPLFRMFYRKRMTAMLDDPQGRDCNEMVGYQVRQNF